MEILAYIKNGFIKYSNVLKLSENNEKISCSLPLNSLIFKNPRFDSVYIGDLSDVDISASHSVGISSHSHAEGFGNMSNIYTRSHSNELTTNLKTSNINIDEITTTINTIFDNYNFEILNTDTIERLRNDIINSIRNI